jgi:2-iminoacetate synthase
VLTFREWLDDFASPETQKEGEEIIKKELKEIKERMPDNVYQKLLEYYGRIKNGERDLYF